MTITTLRFGEITIEEERILSFPHGIPGFEEMRSFTLIDPEQTHPVLWLQSTQDGNIALPVISTFRIIEDYAFDAQDEDVAQLALEDLADLMVLSVVVLTEDLPRMTVNLIAPILINTRNNRGIQVLIEQSQYTVREPVYEPILEYLRKEMAIHAGADAQDR